MDKNQFNSKSISPQNSKEEIEIGPLKSEEEIELLNFYKEFHERGERIATFWQWRRKENSIIGVGTDYVARYKGKIVGAMGINPVIHTYRGSKITAYWQRDTLISPSMRGRGLVKQVLKAASRDWDMVLGKGSNKIMYKIRKSFGWQDVPNSEYMALALQPWPKGKNFKTKFSHLFLYIYGTVLSYTYSKKSISCFEAEEFNSDFDAIADTLSTNSEFKFYKTSSYLTWRYFECPGRSYTVLRIRNKEIKGAIVLRLPRERTDEAWIVDCICDPTDVNFVRELLSAGLIKIRENGANKVLVFSTSSNIRKIMARFGFVSIGRSPKCTYIIKPHHVLANNINNLRWNIWHGDSDNELYE